MYILLALPFSWSCTKANVYVIPSSIALVLYVLLQHFFFRMRHVLSCTGRQRGIIEWRVSQFLRPDVACLLLARAWLLYLTLTRIYTECSGRNAKKSRIVSISRLSSAQISSPHFVDESFVLTYTVKKMFDFFLADTLSEVFGQNISATLSEFL